MMSYTMLCTSLCDSGGMLMRFMSPSTRIIGGTPDGQMQVRGVVLDGESQELRDIDGGHDGPLIQSPRVSNRAYHKAFHSIAKGTSQSVTEITEHLRNIVERVARASALAPRAKSVTIVAVSKQKTSSDIAEAFRAGQRDFGESYAQEAAPKIEALRGLDITWHFIGAVQANKTRIVAENFQWVHTVDRAKIAARLNEQRPHYAPPLNVLIQVNQSARAAEARRRRGRDLAARARDRSAHAPASSAGS